MARSASVKGFWYRKNLSPNVEDPMRLEVILKNTSGTMTIGDVVHIDSGYLEICPTTEIVLGILEGFVDKNGRNIFQSGVSVSGTKTGDDTYASAGDNATVDLVRGVVNVDPNALFYNVADATKLQVDLFQCFDTTASSDQITGSGTDAAAASGQFQLIELVANDVSGATTSSYGGLYKIHESQLFVDDTAT